MSPGRSEINFFSTWWHFCAPCLPLWLRRLLEPMDFLLWSFVNMEKNITVFITACPEHNYLHFVFKSYYAHWVQTWSGYEGTQWKIGTDWWSECPPAATEGFFFWLTAGNINESSPPWRLCLYPYLLVGWLVCHKQHPWNLDGGRVFGVDPFFFPLSSTLHVFRLFLWD